MKFLAFLGWLSLIIIGLILLLTGGILTLIGGIEIVILVLCALLFIPFVLWGFLSLFLYLWDLFNSSSDSPEEYNPIFAIIGIAAVVGIVIAIIKIFF